MTPPLPPRIPRAEAVWPEPIRRRMYDIQMQNEGVLEQIEAAERELEALYARNHDLVSEYERLHRKLQMLDSGDE